MLISLLPFLLGVCCFISFYYLVSAPAKARYNYKIIKVIDKGDLYYLVKERLFWNIWSTVRYYDGNKMFSSQSEAQKYIDKDKEGYSKEVIHQEP